jgi:hypothetical protein
MSELNFYEILGIRADASHEDVKRAYREQMRRYHPDAFAGQMNKAKQNGDLKAMRTLERQIEEAKQKTKQLNTAYDVLSDSTKRQTYDLKRAGVPQNRASAYSQDADPYRSGPYASRDAQNPYRQARPQAPRPRPNPNNDTFPTVWFAVLGIGILMGLGFLYSVFASLPAPEDGLPIVNDGRMSAADLQATTSMQQATRIAWTETAKLPTPTPLSVEVEVAAADTFYEIEAYELAVERYTQAINKGATDASVYVKRGVAYRQLDDNFISEAIADFSTAIARDETLAIAYLERALAKYALWQQTAQDALLDDIRADVAQYQTLVPEKPDERLKQLLENLNEI